MATPLSKEQKRTLEAAQTFKTEEGAPAQFTAAELAGKYNQMFDDNISASNVENRLDKLVKVGMVQPAVFSLTAAGSEDPHA